jgi:hypothetical protein
MDAECVEIIYYKFNFIKESGKNVRHENSPRISKQSFQPYCRRSQITTLGKSITGDMFRSDAFCFLFESLE